MIKLTDEKSKRDKNIQIKGLEERNRILSQHLETQRAINRVYEDMIDRLIRALQDKR